MQQADIEWWQRDDLLLRLIADIVADEASNPVFPSLWRVDTALTDEGGADEGPGLDSLGLTNAASAITRRLHLDESGQEDRLLMRRRLGDWVEVLARSLPHVSRRVTFFSSGSTGRPKPVTHDLDALIGEVARFIDHLGPVRRIVRLVPTHHIYGFLWTVLLPAQGGCSVEDLRSKPWTAAVRALRAGDLVVATPHIWRHLADADVAFPDGVVGLTSTSPCPPDLAQDLCERGLARLIQLYGSTETAGIGWRDAPHAPFSLLPGLSRQEGGCIVAPSGEEVMPPDHLTWQDDTSFYLKGRKDGVVQVAGVNVDPSAVAAVLEKHGDVARAIVRLRHDDRGLKAFVVPREPDSVTLATLGQELQRYVAEYLPAPARPRSYTLGRELPRTAMGKAADWDDDR